MGGHTGSSTAAFSAFLNAAEDCTWSDIIPLSAVLETGGLPLRYFLSPQACGNILLQAEKHGRRLPDILQTALRSVAYTRFNRASAGAAADSHPRSCLPWPAATQGPPPTRVPVS